MKIDGNELAIRQNDLDREGHRKEAMAIKKEFLSGNSGSYPTLFAGYLVSSLPLIALLLFGNKYYVEGLTNSAIKF